jgi:Ca-activated chloride channel family protein
LGSGHTVTALYEIIPAGIKSEFLKEVDPLKYQKNTSKPGISFADEIFTVKFRYKAPDRDNSELIVHAVADKPVALDRTSDNYRFATSVAGFAMLLRNSEYKGKTTFEDVLRLAGGALGTDTEGYRKEFISLVNKAFMLKDNKAGR